MKSDSIPAASRLLGPLLAVLLSLPTLAAPIQSDSFAGTVIDPARWQVPPHPTGNAVLSQNNGLFYHNNGSGTADDEVRLWSVGEAPVASDWTVRFDAHVPDLAALTTPSQRAGLEIKIWNSANDSERSDIQTSILRAPDPYGKIRTVGADITTDYWVSDPAPGGSTGVFLDPATQSRITLAYSWKASTTTLSAWYAPAGGGINWIRLGSWNLGVGSPTEWSLGAGASFLFYIGGSSSSLNLLPSENIRITDFVVSGSALSGRIPPTITTGTNPSRPDVTPLTGASKDVPYAATIGATGGVLPHAWSMVIGSLPPGLTLAPATGTIQGTPNLPGTYPFRVRVTGADGAYADGSYSITVGSPHPPLVITLPATNITATGATLNGTVNPNGLATTAQFEYGLTSAYGSTASVTLSPNNGTTAQNASPSISGLTPGQTYHYRLTASNSEATGTGADMTFATAALPAPEIAVEQPLGTNLTDGSASIGFGSVNPGSSSSAFTFTVKNLGTANLSGLAVTKDGTNSADFTVGTLGTATLAPGASTSFTVTFSPGASGARSAAIHIANNDADENPFDIMFTGNGTTDVAGAIDLPGATVTGGGTAPWFSQSTTTHDGVDAARSEAIGNSQESWMQTSFTGPGTLTFWWKVSSESNYDYLEFYLDGTLQSGRISGTVDWQLKTHSIAAGTHTVKWRYMKDGSVNSGSDCGWVDQVVFMPDVPAPIVTTGPATWDTSSTVTLTGTVNANGQASTARFEFGPTTAYGTVVPVTLSPDNGTTAQSVSVDLGMLPPGTPYHYRLTATSANGTTSGADRTLVTERVSGDYKYTTCDSTATVTGYTGAGGVFTIPNTINGLAVVSIGYRAFAECGVEFSLTIPEGVIRIGDEAFTDCYGMTHIALPASVTSIGNNALAWTVLVSITVDPANPEYSSLDGVLFNRARTKLIQYPGGRGGAYSIPPSVKHIGDSAFEGCEALTGVTIPDGVISIGVRAFHDCSGLPEVRISKFVESIGYGALADLHGALAIMVDDLNPYYADMDGVLFDKLQTKLIQCPAGKTGAYLVPSGVISIEDEAFAECYTLTSVIISDGVTSIGNELFNDCNGLENVTIPASVTSIGYAVFDGCDSLVSINMDGANPNYSSADGVLFDKEKFTLIQCPGGKTGRYDIPAGVKTIWYDAFNRCGGLTNITIPAGATSIRDRAFEDCSGLSSLTIPASVTNIGNEAFGDCDRLASVTFLGNAPTVPSGYIGEAPPTLFTVYYPAGGTGFTSPEWMGHPTVALSASREIVVTAPGGIGLTDAGAGFDFGNIHPGNRTVKAFTILNAGLTDLSGLGVTIDGTNVGDFTVGPLGATTLATGASTTFAVEFAPTALGNRTAAIHIESNDADESPFDISLVGNGLDPALNVAAAIDLPGTAITHGGQADWLWQTAITHDGTDAARSGEVAHNQSSSFELSATGPGTVSFWWKVSSEWGCDYLEFFIDGVMQSGGISGDMGWQQKSYAIGAGQHTLRWAYSKDDGSREGSDCGWVDQVGFVPAPDVTTGPATWDTSSTVRLTGTVNPNGYATTAQFEYGPTTAYGTVKTVTLSPSDGANTVSVAADLGTLPAGTAYHYRLTATNNGGSPTTGADRTFVTGRVSGDYIYTTCENSATITGYTGAGGAIAIPDALNGLPVIGIGYQAFYNKATLTSVIIPASVSTIGNYAFDGCSGLTVVSVPTGVTSLGRMAFFRCTALSSVTIPGTTTRIGPGPFSGCTALIGIMVDAANPNYSSLDGALFNRDLTTLFQCPDGKTGDYTIPGSVTTIADWTFYGCAVLTQISIPESVTTIESAAFRNCTGPSGITVDADNPNYCTLDGVLFNKARTTLIQYPGGKTGAYTIPIGVTSIADWAFYPCTGLTSVIIPNSVISIGYSTFRYCLGLTSVTIPSSVVNMGDNAFISCAGLKSAVFAGNAPTMGFSAFANSATGFTVYFFNGATGFTTPTWNGYAAVNMGAQNPFSGWLVTHGLPHNSDLQSDPNGDGVNLLMAYALNLDPNLNLAGSMPQPVFANNQMSLSFYGGREDVTYSVEFSTDLTTWSTSGVTVSAPDANNHRTASVPMTGPRRFLRLALALTEDQQIRALYSELMNRAAAHDEAGFLALFAPDYLHQGENLMDKFDEPEFLDTVESFTFNVTGITITGNQARVSGSVTITFNNGDPAETWTEPDTSDNDGLGWLRKTPAGWRVIGDQVRAQVRLTTAHNTASGDDHYYFQMRAESSLPIKSVSVSGPGIATTELQPDLEWSGYNGFAGNFTSAGCPPVGTTYTFVVHFPDGSQETYQDSVKAWVTPGPVISVTPGAGTATFNWTDIGAAVPNADSYWVRVVGGNVYWQSDRLPLTQSSITFNADGTSAASLVVGQTYRVWVFIFDVSENYSFQTYDFTMPQDGFALIPAGPFQMGDQSNPLVGYSSELPVHTVQVSAFHMGKYEVTKEEWDAVRAWGLANGYTDLAVGNGGYASKGANHPVHSITWYDMVKWCNARSQKEGLTPCYTVSGATYKTGSSDAVTCNWSANGYRLPTEAEWEKAARGGVSGKNFPWGTDTITHSQANYMVYSTNGTTNYYGYDMTPRPPATGTYFYHPTYAVGGYPYSSPVGSFAPNGYGLYDMAGNMWEWCWDWYGSYAAGSQTDPHGAASGSYRVVRGGGWDYNAYDPRCARRSHNWPGNASDYDGGFRVVRGQS